MDTAGGVLLMIGAGFALIAGIGVNRFTDPYSRMHTAAKSPTLGLILVVIGASLQTRSWPAVCIFILVAVLQLLTSPVSTHVAARAVHLRMRVPMDGVDELARDESGAGTARADVDGAGADDAGADDAVADASSSDPM
jgi:multicomponent Na+:H+ antiporter subunit G